MIRPLSLIAVLLLVACSSNVPDRFAAAPIGGPFAVDDWQFTTRALPQNDGVWDILVVRDDGPSYFKEDGVQTKARYVAAAEKSLAGRCAGTEVQMAERAWEALTAKSSSMVVRVRCLDQHSASSR